MIKPRNYIAKDLRTPKYRTRIVQSQRRRAEARAAIKSSLIKEFHAHFDQKKHFRI
jgi:hypothetical protein